MACLIFFQSWFEAHPLCGLTLPAVLFPLESRESWGLCGCPLPTLPSCLSWCLHPAGKSSVGLISQEPWASGCGVSPGEAGKCWDSSKVVLCLHQFCTTSNHLTTSGLTICLSFAAQVEPILCPSCAPLLPSPPTSCPSALPAPPRGLVAGVTRAVGGGVDMLGLPCLLHAWLPFFRPPRGRPP